MLEENDLSPLLIEKSPLHSGTSPLHNGKSSLHKKEGTQYEILSQKVFSLLKGKKRVSPELLRQAILLICENDFLALMRLPGCSGARVARGAFIIFPGW